MRNKGFFWFLTILLTAVCLFQLSFTYTAIDVENDAEKQADRLVIEAQEQAKTNNNIYVLASGDTINFNQPDALEIAKSAFVNQILKDKSKSEVFLGFNYAEVKNRSLAFGLDLVGGMSVTMEISVPALVESYAQRKDDPVFKKPFDEATRIHNTKGGDFLDVFIEQYKRFNGNRLIASDLDLTEVPELKINSNNQQVEEYFRNLIASSMDGVEQIMSNRINQFGVAQPNIQKENGSNRLYIELPGVQDEATVAKKLISSANLEFFETYTLEQMAPVLGMVDVAARTPEVNIDLSQYEVKLDTTGVKNKDSLMRIQDSMTKLRKDSAIAKVAKPSKTKTKGLKEMLKPGMGSIIAQVRPEDRDDVNAILNRQDIKAQFPEELRSTLRWMWSAKMEKSITGSKEELYSLYAIKTPEDGKAKVGGSDIQEAGISVDPSTNERTVTLRMSADGQDRWGAMTTENVKKVIAITMDGVVYSAPNVINPITSGNTQITGNFSVEEAQDLAGILNGGALPAPCVIKDLTKVGPTIGAENSKSGLISFAFAFLAVFIYMYFYYGRGGLVADIALFVNVILIFGSLASFGAVLTLAGIAGIVLTIGTAVDANILIFERVKEEIALGKTTEEAVRIGNIKALPSIIDANMTHLLVAIILKVFGKGEIESFATTLIVGIFTSVFSAIIISKLIISTQLEKGRTVSFGTKFTHNLFSNFNFDWIGKRKYFYIFSIVITIAGAASLFSRGLKQSVEFTGGRSYGISISKPVDVDKIEEKLKAFLKEEGKEAASVEVKTKSTDLNLEITTNYMLSNSGANDQVKAKLNEGLESMKSEIGSYEHKSFRSISASVSAEMWSSASIAITLSLLAIFAYIFLRFGQWQYSLGAILGLAHDVLVVLSVFSLLHGIMPFTMDIDQAFIAAVLTVIGYSMNDTVIVFDRIRESLNFDKGQHEAKGVINDALNKTLSRTFNTSMILFVVLLIMFIFGGPSIKGFLFALLIGVVIGTYSSLCVATPILVDFTKKFKTKSTK